MFRWAEIDEVRPFINRLLRFEIPPANIHLVYTWPTPPGPPLWFRAEDAEIAADALPAAHAEDAVDA